MNMYISGGFLEDISAGLGAVDTALQRGDSRRVASKSDLPELRPGLVWAKMPGSEHTSDGVVTLEWWVVNDKSVELPELPLKEGSLARGSFTAQFPTPPAGMMWQMVPGTSLTPAGATLTTNQYRLIWMPGEKEKRQAPLPDVSKLLSTEEELTTQVQREMGPSSYTPPPSATVVPGADLVAYGARKPWYARPVVVGSVALGFVFAGVTAYLLMKD